MELRDGRPPDGATDPVGGEPAAPRARGLKRGAYLVLAGLFLAVGALGAVLPGLPTTPFVLLASFLLSRSSPRWNAALRRSRVFGPILADWQDRRGVRRAVKVQAIVLIVLFAGGAVVFSERSGMAWAVILALGLVGITVVALLPAIPAGQAPLSGRRQDVAAD